MKITKIGFLVIDKNMRLCLYITSVGSGSENSRHLTQSHRNCIGVDTTIYQYMRKKQNCILNLGCYQS